MLSESVITDVLLAALSTGGDFAEIFMEDTFNTQIRMLDGAVEEAVSGRDHGVGIRIFQGLRSVYAYTNDLRRESLMKTAREAAAALPGVPQGKTVVLARMAVDRFNPVRLEPRQVPHRDKVEVMKKAHLAAADFHEQITQVVVHYLDVDQNVLIANSEGLLAEDRRVRTRLSINAVATRGEEKQSAFRGPGRHMGFELFERIDVEEIARDAAHSAVTMVNADYAPGGKYPVIIDNEFGGVIFHEACGHSLEATSVAKGVSEFSGKLGEKIASELVTAVDDGTIPNAWGSQNIDDEGTKTRRNVLIEKGILKGYMIDRLNARRMGMEPTGNARRQSYKFAPTSRMTNTFICAGESTREEIIANTEYGLYAKRMGGGSVNPATGEFNFAVAEGYMVRGGKIAEPVRGATLIGRGSEILQKIDMVASNLATGQGMCGSVSGSIPADVGQPTIRVTEMTVGGRKEAN
ncbi:MAG TPA: TldD/PmbA family protein [Limnochordia bacterium]|nr:TldD/PmbA family protein [Limnochordia bacterium]HPP72536.1 TldD/PmbA family protein [Limnochordia bacterium]